MDDTAEIVRALRASGHERVILAGVCAGSWIALRAVLAEPADGVIALNPQMFWQWGGPIDARISDSALRRTPQREEEILGRLSGRCDELDREGERCWTAQWLDDLHASGVPVALLYADGDDGLAQLNDRVARRLEQVTADGQISLTVLPDVDHAMHMTSRRPDVFARCDELLTDGTLAPAERRITRSTRSPVQSG